MCLCECWQSHSATVFLICFGCMALVLALFLVAIAGAPWISVADCGCSHLLAHHTELFYWIVRLRGVWKSGMFLASFWGKLKKLSVDSGLVRCRCRCVRVCVFVSRKKNVVFDLNEKKSVKIQLGNRAEQAPNIFLNNQIPVSKFSSWSNVICKRNKTHKLWMMKAMPMEL